MSAANEPEPTALPARRAVPALPRVRPRVVLCEEDRVPHHAKPKPDADVFLPVEGRMRKSSGEASSRVSKRTAQEQCWPAWTRLCRPIFLLLSVLQFHQPRGPLRDLGHSELPHRGDLQSFLQYLMSRQLPVLWRWVPGSHLPDPLCGCRGGGVGTHPGGVRVAGDVPCPSCCPRGPEQTRRTLRETLMKWNSRDQEECLSRDSSSTSTSLSAPFTPATACLPLCFPTGKPSAHAIPFPASFCNKFFLNIYCCL
ncbi:uncharacterized protein LOC123978514 isoform X2 [Micropterus dolomieu]|uniref:uncharacterized protein LOC123978514 isoform X2 n=1 Tax=Micropterus dolomieu TaxID=147949 RepID=UPI001E8E9272|nr:uncharacterized protein LOC123978514 isoform X2 [Micropterus dolomieu]